MSRSLTEIIENWFLTEPALFRAVCTHSIEQNTSMACPLRSGRRRIEYNPGYLDNMSDEAVEESLKTEALRILLKHPYQRKPDGCCLQAIAVGSNITIGDNFKYSYFNIEDPSTYRLETGREYEWYSRRIQELLSGEGQGDGKGDGKNLPSAGANDNSGSSPETVERLRDNRDHDTALSGLWEEDELTAAMIDEVIGDIKDWGSVPGSLVEKIKASARAKIDWRNVLSGFRGSILSSKRRLTRMRPNRRTDFENMGSIRRFETKLLVAVDVSGSISSRDLEYFYGVVNSAFRYGFSSVDLIQFDFGVKAVQSLKSVMRETVVLGRGGTSFQEPIDYAHENGYDGLLILTDGYAPEPSIPAGMRCKIAWVCCNQRCYDAHHTWMERSGRVCVMEIL